MEKLISEKELPDALWKAIVTEMLPDFIDFFIPELYEVIDFNRGFEFLEQELEKIIKKSKKHRKYTDKLVKVYLKDGKEQWILKLITNSNTQFYAKNSLKLSRFLA
jgi:hypothetical protein